VSRLFTSLLATIRSRCQSIQVITPTEADALAWMEEQTIENAAQLLQLAGGAPLKAKNWSDTEFINDFEKVNSDLLALIRGEDTTYQVAKRWQNMDALALVEIQIMVLDSLIKATFEETDILGVHKGLAEVLAEIDITFLFRLRDSLVSKVSQLRSFANLNEGLLVEELAMDWSALQQLAARRPRISSL
jgi:DNA polymerase-3 subunit delta'